MGDVFSAIISNLAGFLSLFAPGYIFLCCYQYSGYLPRETEIDYLFIKCISLSCIFVAVSNALVHWLSIDTAYTFLIIFSLAIVLGLLIGRIHRTTWASEVSQFIFKREITNSFFVYLWELANDADSIVFLRVRMNGTTDIYDGQICQIFGHAKDSEILLAYYRRYDAQGTLIEDYSQVDKAYLLVRYSNIQCFEYELDRTICEEESS